MCDLLSVAHSKQRSEILQLRRHYTVKEKMIVSGTVRGKNSLAGNKSVSNICSKDIHDNG